MAISDQLTLLNNTKTAIRTAINNKGGSVTDSTPFADYSTAIDNLPSGGDNSALIDLIERDITTLNIPSGTTKIGDNAFTNCTSLASVTIPSSVTYIGTSAFSACSSLTSVTFPNSVTYILDYAFQSCTSISGTITIPSSVIRIGKGAFGYGQFSELILNGGGVIGGIGGYDQGAFVSNSHLNSVTIGSGVTELGVNTFKDCTRLTSVVIPDSVTTIRTYCFSGCHSIKNVSIGSGVTLMDQQCFVNCSSLETVAIHATTPPTLGAKAFINTNQNLAIYVPAESVDAYKAANNWSTYASRIVGIEDAVRLTPTNGDPAISVKNYELATANYVQSTDVPSTIKNGAGSLEISEGVTRIGTFAFQSGSSLTSVTIPSTVTRIDDAAFDGCSSLTSVTVNATTPPTLYASVFSNTNNCPIYVPAASVDAYKAANNWSTYASRIQAIQVSPALKWTSADGTQEISIACEDLATSGTFSIEDRDNADPDDLMVDVEGSAEIGSCVTSIGDYAFTDCSSLTSVTIGNGITSIGNNAFGGCGKLTSVTVNATTPPVSGYLGLNGECTVYVPAESVSAYQSDDGWTVYNIQPIQ